LVARADARTTVIASSIAAVARIRPQP